MCINHNSNGLQAQTTSSELRMNFIRLQFLPVLTPVRVTPWKSLGRHNFNPKTTWQHVKGPSKDFNFIWCFFTWDFFGQFIKASAKNSALLSVVAVMSRPHIFLLCTRASNLWRILKTVSLDGYSIPNDSSHSLRTAFLNFQYCFRIHFRCSKVPRTSRTFVSYNESWH